MKCRMFVLSVIISLRSVLFAACDRAVSVTGIVAYESDGVPAAGVPVYYDIGNNVNTDYTDEEGAFHHFVIGNEATVIIRQSGFNAIKTLHGGIV